jgi:hypothetical protein
MGNHPSKEKASSGSAQAQQPSSSSSSHGLRQGESSSAAAAPASSAAAAWSPVSPRPFDPSASNQATGARRRTSRHDLSIFGLAARGDVDPAAPEARKETKAEREARKLEKERAVREKERERSVKEEGVDGGYMVTLGVYTGTEHFSKGIVRQLMVCIGWLRI